MPFCCHLLRGALRRRETLALRQPAAREGFEARLPTGWGVAKTQETILSVHAPLNEVWGRGYGYRPMLGESEVLLDILQDLAARRIPALGLHDGLLVAVSDKEAMRRVAKAVTGIDLPVSEK